MKGCNRVTRFYAVLATLIVVGPGLATAGETCTAIAGFVETVDIADPPRALEAKLDTGAETSALSARDIVPFARDGAQWLRFTVPVAEGGGAVEPPVEAPVVRYVRIRRAGTKTERRPVVVLPLGMGGTRFTAEFTLTDRAGLDYPVLIGRAALAGRIAVDSARTHLAPVPCPR
jgi:hypothetical protein